MQFGQTVSFMSVSEEARRQRCKLLATLQIQILHPFGLLDTRQTQQIKY